jgi:hypothetical protein
MKRVAFAIAALAGLASGEDILLEPTVRGKSGVEARVSCRKALQVPS